MGHSNRKRNIIIASAIATILVVAAVTVAAEAETNGSSKNATAKAVEAICAPTDHNETCVNSLAGANTTDPKELIKLAFNATAKNIGDVLKNSSLLKDAAAEDVLDSAVDDLRRSMPMAAAYVEDLKTKRMEPSNSTEINETQPAKQIFILSGQSNMAGRGGVNYPKQFDGVVPPEASPDRHRIFRLNAHLQWEVAREPLHQDIDTNKTCGLGPGMVFANAVKERVGVIGLVPCAVGGTAIREWSRGMYLYENMVKRAKAAVHDGGEIRALLWYQGESDTSSQQEVDSYKESMETLIHNVRADLGLPSLPIIQVALASGIDVEFTEKIREIQKGIELPNVVCVDGEGLPLKGDKLHLTTEAEVQLGRMLADAYLTHFANKEARASLGR